jgi:transcription-repair coupling factor (superfamily II helicase)
LDEAVRELKETEFRDLYVEEREKLGDYVSDCVLETDLEILIPDHYITDIAERLSIYRELDNLDSDTQLEEYRIKLKDRFGNIPEQTEALLHTIRLRWLAKEIGFEKLTLKNESMIGFFVANQDSVYYQSKSFTKVLDFIKHNPAGYKMYEKNGGLRLSKNHIKDILSAIHALNPILSGTPQLA